MNWISTKQRIKWKAHNTVGVSPVMLESPAPLSQVYHSYNEPLYSPDLYLNDK